MNDCHTICITILLHVSNFYIFPKYCHRSSRLSCFTVSLFLCAWFLTMGNSIEQHRAAIGSFYSSCRCVFLTARYVIPFTILFPEHSFFVNRFVSLLTCVRDNAVLINFYLQFFTFILLLSVDICQLIFCRHSDYIIYVYSINVLRKVSYCGLIIIRVSANLDNG